jgi:DNA-binding NarL/FixJ family response regulator
LIRMRGISSTGIEHRTCKGLREFDGNTPGAAPLEWISARGLAASANLAQLREVVAAADRVRRVRLPPEAVLSAWRALHGGCWSIVASVERDGQRLLVARPNAPLRIGAPLASTEATSRRRPEHPRHLSAQESRVLAALAKGHTNKLIAYELGLATSTVGTLLARAARKLGCNTRIELARVGRALTRQSASQQGAKERA